MLAYAIQNVEKVNQIKGAKTNFCLNNKPDN